jgi:hypothetical protein
VTWQSHKKKCIFPKGLPRFARNDTLAFNVIAKRVA